MKLDRRVATFGIGATLFAVAGARKHEISPSNEMILANNDSWMRLRIVGYEFPGNVDDGWDSNWLVVSGSVRLTGREWQFTDPCLTTFEAKHLADWLEACARGSAEDPYCSFTEPLLQFELLNPQTMRISFALEAAPPWAKEGDDWTKHGFNIPVGPPLVEAATALRHQLRDFPARGSAKD